MRTQRRSAAERSCFLLLGVFIVLSPSRAGGLGRSFVWDSSSSYENDPLRLKLALANLV